LELSNAVDYHIELIEINENSLEIMGNNIIIKDRYHSL